MTSNLYKIFFAAAAAIFASQASIYPRIKNAGANLCIKCKHFIPDRSNYPYDPPPNDSQYGKCALFGHQDPVTGAIIHIYASTERKLGTECGPAGKLFEAAAAAQPSAPATKNETDLNDKQ